MGTRGAVCLVVDETEKVIYNHYDSYPGGLGEDVVGWLRAALAMSEVETRSAVSALRPVPDAEPTPEDFERLAKFRDPHVNRGEGWYSLLRHTQGDLALTLKAGLYESAANFPYDSLFCEWAYVVDFDARRFEVYRGFSQSPPSEGRWVGRDGEGGDPSYYPVQRIKSWSFDELPASIVVELDGDS